MSLRPMSPQERNQGFSNSFDLYPIQENSSRTQWKVESPASHAVQSAEMLRFPSQDSVGGRSQRTTNSFDHDFDQGRSTAMFPSISQMSYQMSSARSDATVRSNSPGNDSLYSPIQRNELHAFGNFPYPEDFSIAPVFSRRGSIAGNTSAAVDLSLTTVPSYDIYSTAGEEEFVHMPAGPHMFDIQSQETVIFNPNTKLWESGNCLGSQASSPVLAESWMVPAVPIMNTNSPIHYSPSLESMSPRYAEDFPDLDLVPYTATANRTIRKPIGPRPSKVASDLAAASRRQRTTGVSEASEESSTVGRSGPEVDNSARDHPAYQNVMPHADGLYHCPWENDPNSMCQHKPEKLKCNYEYASIFVSLHLCSKLIMLSLQ